MISTIRQALCPLIEVFITGITIPICVHFGNTQRIWLIVIGIYSIIAAVCGMICFLPVRPSAYRSRRGERRARRRAQDFGVGAV